MFVQFHSLKVLHTGTRLLDCRSDSHFLRSWSASDWAKESTSFWTQPWSCEWPCRGEHHLQTFSEIEHNATQECHFSKRQHRSGPSTEPWGTPDNTSTDVELAPETTTCCFLPCK